MLCKEWGRVAPLEKQLKQLKLKRLVNLIFYLKGFISMIYDVTKRLLQPCLTLAEAFQRNACLGKTRALYKKNTNRDFIK